jgi:dTDP-4-dehydrorhamnose reductase
VATVGGRTYIERNAVEGEMVTKIFVTGASGLLGQRLVTLATSKGYDVCSLYHTHAPKGGRPVRVDLTDAKAVNDCVQAETPDAVINTASMTNVDLCERQPESAMQMNANAPRMLAESCDRADAFLVHVSTDYVFDGNKGNYAENDEPDPINHYGRSKLQGEREVTSYEYSCVARTSVVYGWGEHRTNFGTWLYDNLIASKAVNAVTGQYASPTFNGDLARMVLELAERRIRGIVHVAGATRASRYEFAVRLAKEFHFDTKLIVPVESSYIGWVAKRPRDSSLNVAKAMEILNNKPVELDEALRQFAREAPQI